MTQRAPYRVMVVDESAVVRGLLTRALEADDAISVVATVATCEAALRTLDRKDIEIIVLDFEMPELDGMTALPPLLAAKPGAQVIMTSTPTRRNAEVSLRALSMGAADCLTRPASPSEILSAAAFQRELHDKIKAVAEAGAFAVVVEGTSEAVARQVTAEIPIPTIGIGASAACDGQILVTDELLGLAGDWSSGFAKRFADLGPAVEEAVTAYAGEVRDRRFPAAGGDT